MKRKQSLPNVENVWHQKQLSCECGIFLIEIGRIEQPFRCGSRLLHCASARRLFFPAGSWPGKKRPALICVSLATLGVSLSGCVDPIPPKALAKKVMEKKEPAPIPARIDGRGWHIAWRSRDTRKAEKKALPILIADAKSGAFLSDTDPPSIGLNTVQAQIFQNGKHVADLQAAHIDANRGEETIYGSGGITLYSRVNPPDTTISADTMQWKTDGSRLIAEGNAHITRPAKNGKQAFAQSGNRIVYDMKQGNFDVQ